MEDSSAATARGTPVEASDVMNHAVRANKIDVAGDGLNFGGIASSVRCWLRLGEDDNLVHRTKSVVARSGVHFGPNVVNLSEGAEKESHGACQLVDVSVLREVGDFQHHSCARQGQANKVALESGSSVNERSFGQGGHVCSFDANVDKAATAEACRKVDRESRVEKASVLQEAFNLVDEGAASRVLFPRDCKGTGEPPSNGAGGDLGSIRTRERKVLEGNQGRSGRTRRRVGTRSGIAACSPQVLARDDGLERVGVWLSEEVCLFSGSGCLSRLGGGGVISSIARRHECRWADLIRNLNI